MKVINNLVKKCNDCSHYRDSHMHPNPSYVTPPRGYFAGGYNSGGSTCSTIKFPSFNTSTLSTTIVPLPTSIDVDDTTHWCSLSKEWIPFDTTIAPNELLSTVVNIPEWCELPDATKTDIIILSLEDEIKKGEEQYG